MSLDDANGDLLIGDVGWNSFEEINRAPTTGAGGLNFGWPYYEGGNGTQNRTNGYKDRAEAQAVYDGSVTPVGTLTPSLFARSHSDGGTAFMAGEVLRGGAWPVADRGGVLFTDWNDGEIELLVDGDTRVVVTGDTRLATMRASNDGTRIFTAGTSGRIGVIEYV
jgi:hypothetical protein